MAWTATPDRPLTLLYDGNCRFCTAGSERLLRAARSGVLRRVSSKDEHEMAKFPDSVRSGLQAAMQIVSPDGDIATGAEAAARALATRPAWRLITWLYWVPGIRQLTDWLYTIIARNRYRIMGKTGASCETGQCARP